LKRVKIMGVFFHSVTLEQACMKIKQFLLDRGNHVVVTPNTEIVMMAQKDSELRKIINQSHLAVADGIGVVWASKHLGQPLPERVAGFDLMDYILRQGKDKGYRIYLLGGKPGVAEKAAKNIHSRYPGIQVVGCHHGYFSKEEEQQVIDDINLRKPQFLFVAMGAPKQEKWIFKHKDELEVKVSMGVGGSLDVLSGEVKRAPKTFRNLGLEWLYRLVTQPSRIVRMMALPVFVLKVLITNKNRERVNNR